MVDCGEQRPAHKSEPLMASAGPDPWHRLHAMCMGNWEEALDKVPKGGGTRQMPTTQKPPPGCDPENSSVLAFKETSQKPSPGTCAGCSKGRRGKAIKGRKKNRSSQSGVAWQPRGPGCLLSQRTVEGKSLNSHASGATAKGIEAFITLHPL